MGLLKGVSMKERLEEEKVNAASVISIHVPGFMSNPDTLLCKGDRG